MPQNFAIKLPISTKSVVSMILTTVAQPTTNPPLRISKIAGVQFGRVLLALGPLDTTSLVEFLAELLSVG